MSGLNTFIPPGEYFLIIKLEPGAVSFDDAKIVADSIKDLPNVERVRIHKSPLLEPHKPK